jgi:hypothetical protein
MRKTTILPCWRGSFFAGRGRAAVYAALVVSSVAAVAPQQALAQVVADGVVVFATGTISTPTQIALQAINGGVIQTIPPLVVSGFGGASADSGGRVNIAGGSMITSTFDALLRSARRHRAVWRNGQHHWINDPGHFRLWALCC